MATSSRNSDHVITSYSLLSGPNGPVNDRTTELKKTAVAMRDNLNSLLLAQQQQERLAGHEL